jgi:hypothetical protein
MRRSIVSKSLIMTWLFLLPVLCPAKEVKNSDSLEIITDFTYRIGSEDTKEKYKALGLYGAKIKAVELAAKYLTHKGLLENYGQRQKEIFCLAADELNATTVAEKYLEENNSYYLKIKTIAKSADFIRAEIRNLKLDEEEKNFSWQEEMEQYVYPEIDPALELSRAYRYIRKKHWRIAIIYLDHLEKKYPNWGEIFLAKAIGFYGMHEIGKMMDSLQTACSIGNQGACEDLKSLTESHDKDF